MQGTYISEQNHELSASQNHFNDLLNNTIQQGKALLKRNQIIESYVETQTENLSNSKRLEELSAKKTTQDLIRDNVGQDLRDLNYDVVRSNLEPSPFKTYLHDRVDGYIDKMKHDHEEVSNFQATQQQEEEDDTVFEQEEEPAQRQVAPEPQHHYQEEAPAHQEEIGNYDHHEEVQAQEEEYDYQIQDDEQEDAAEEFEDTQGLNRTKHSGMQATDELARAIQRTTPLVPKSKLQATHLLKTRPGEKKAVVNDINLINRYHALRQKNVTIKRKTIKFAENRINPPKCLSDALDALFSLIYGIYTRLDQNYFKLKYLKNVNELYDVVSNLKLYAETQGIPERNIKRAASALEKYNKSVKLVESRNYVKSTNEIARFVGFFIEYYNILRKLHLEPMTKLNTQPPMNLQRLKNSIRQDWRDQVYEAPEKDTQFSEAELLHLVKTTVRKKTFFIIRGIKEPPASILHGVKGLHALLNNFIKEPGYKMRYVWPWYQTLLRDTIPQLINDLPALLQEGKISEANIQAAEGYLNEFEQCMKTRKELNDSFVLQYATKIMNLIYYVGRLWRIYNPESQI